jgi:hypothetical protein
MYINNKSKDIRKDMISRHRKSKFEPYISLIRNCLESGYTISQIANEIEPSMDDIVNENALYCFIKSRGLKSKVTQGGTNKNCSAPKCDGCQECREIINTNDNKCLLCMESMRMINRSCHTSPMWCKKRERQAG